MASQLVQASALIEVIAYFWGQRSVMLYLIFAINFNSNGI